MIESPMLFPVTLILALIIFVSGIIGINQNRYFHRLLMHPYSIVHEKNYYRFLTSEFVHNDFVHLVLNVGFLYVVGSRLELHFNHINRHGGLDFLYIYMWSLFLGNLYITIRYRNDFNYLSAGASGSIMGCLMSFMLLEPHKVAFYLPGAGGVTNQFIPLIYILVLILLQRKKKLNMLNHELHFFGALGGIIATLTLYPGIL